MRSALELSLIVASAATAIVFVVGLAAAVLLAKRRFVGRELLAAALTMPLVLPPTVTGFFLIVLFGREGLIGKWLYQITGWQITFTVYAAVLAAVVTSLPLMIVTARAALENVDAELELAARNLGCNRWMTFWRVTLPLARRGVIAGTILSFARALGEFGATIMLAGNIAGKTQTMPLAIYEAVFSGDNRRAVVLSLILTAVSITAIYLTNKLTDSKTFFRHTHNSD